MTQRESSDPRIADLAGDLDDGLSLPAYWYGPRHVFALAPRVVSQPDRTGTSAALDGTTRREIAYDPHGPLAQSQYHFLRPNITISINPGLPNLSIEVWNPDGPGRARGFSEQYFGADVPEDVASEMMAFDAQVGAEDDALTDSVQLGLRAGLPAQGRSLMESEQLVIRFQRMVLSALS